MILDNSVSLVALGMELLKVCDSHHQKLIYMAYISTKVQLWGPVINFLLFCLRVSGEQTFKNQDITDNLELCIEDFSGKCFRKFLDLEIERGWVQTSR